MITSASNIYLQTMASMICGLNCFFPFAPVRLEPINSLFKKKQFNRKHAAPDGAFLARGHINACLVHMHPTACGDSSTIGKYTLM